jgi:hypothetical protein
VSHPKNEKCATPYRDAVPYADGVFERFTDRARRVVVLAQEESRLLNHNYIGTEHVLLGLISEGDGVAAQVLEGMEISLPAVRAEVQAIIGEGSRAPSGHIPFTPRAKKVLELSLREALQLGHNYIGTEHILLGLLREGEGVGAEVLIKLGAGLSAVRQEVVRVLAESPVTEEGLPPKRVTEAEPGSWRGPSPVGSGRPAGIEPARCGFCGTHSPTCGPLFTGVGGLLICEGCIAAAFTQRSAFLSPMRPEPESAATRAERYVPTGPAPADEDAARQAIAYAFTDPMELAADGTTLVNVEDGEELAPYAAEVRARVGSYIDERENVVEHVKFLNDRHAVVWTTVRLRSAPSRRIPILHEGRAVLVDGRWKVSRETICERWEAAGVHVPPRRRDTAG